MAAYPAAYPPALQPTGPTSRVELRISCKKLIRGDLLSKSDPMVVVYTQNQQYVWTEYGRTEHIKNNQSPQFTKAVEITYQFEVAQKLRFAVYDIDNETPTLDDDLCLGTMECTLGEIVSARSFTKPLKFQLSHSVREEGTGTITVCALRV
jgi:hypothetical protein